MCNHSKLLWDVSHTWLETQQQNHWHQAEKWRRKSISLQKGSSLSILTQTTAKNHTFLLAASRICNYHSLKLWLEIFTTKAVSPTKCDICCHNIVPPTADRSIMCPMEKLCNSNPTEEDCNWKLIKSVVTVVHLEAERSCQTTTSAGTF